ncbi:Uncharacterised protein, partial [Mycoplasmopsis edwardii]
MLKITLLFVLSNSKTVLLKLIDELDDVSKVEIIFLKKFSFSLTLSLTLLYSSSSLFMLSNFLTSASFQEIFLTYIPSW